MRKTQGLILFVLITMAHAAYVYGDIYREDLQKLNKTAIRIDGKFSYQLVTDKANYSIFLPEGEYTISASASDSGSDLRSVEKVAVGPQDQRVDLVLKPVWRMEYLLFVLGVIAVIFLWSNKHRDKKSAQSALPAIEEPGPLQPKKIELDNDAKSVLRVLEGMEGRATQKELKETLKFSDAKLSLILTELEQLGRVRKFRRGRANVIRKIS
jgi:hypothetical protein